jgi:predicted nucleic acid-binding protein
VIVYIETNFLLEVAYLQESYESCEEILELAKSGSISLVLPACCIAEAYLAWHGRNARRHKFHTELQNHIRELSRSAPFRGLGDQYRDVMAVLIESEESRKRLVDVISRIESDGATIPLTAAIVFMVEFHEDAYSLSPQDALVLASVKAHAELRSGSQCFVTRDRGFDKHKIREELRNERSECKVIFSFGDAVSHIRSVLSRS